MSAKQCIIAGAILLMAVTGSGRAGAQPVFIPAAKGSDPVGTWWLNSNASHGTDGWRNLLVVSGTAPNYTAVISNEGGPNENVDSISYSPPFLTFRRIGNNYYEWFQGTITSGTISGRYSFANGAPGPFPGTAQLQSPFTGWNQTYIDAHTNARSYNLVTNNVYLANIKFDSKVFLNPITGTHFTIVKGTHKTYARTDINFPPANAEENEYDMTNLSYTGGTISYRINGTGWYEDYHLVFSGRSVVNDINQSFFTFNGGSTHYPVTGVRANVLSHGMDFESPSWWRERARAALKNIISDMAEIPYGFNALELSPQGPRTDVPLASRNNRDDNPDQWTQSYTLREVKISGQIVNKWGWFIPRDIKAWLSVPTSAAPPGGFPVVVSVNGHIDPITGYDGAWEMASPAGQAYWYGESFARRGYVVLRIDISHRVDSPLYGFQYPSNDLSCPFIGGSPLPYDGKQFNSWYFDCHDPSIDHDLPAHPSVLMPQFKQSEWQEDGERVFDVSAGLDYLDTLSYVNHGQYIITGLSLGGEVTSYAAALDTRFAAAIVAGNSPDFNVISNFWNHPCFKWTTADLNEYLDYSDLGALIVPRGLIIETGIEDGTYSARPQPFAGDKQNARRITRAYTAEGVPNKFLFYLHDDASCNGNDAHLYRVGDFNPACNVQQGIRTPVLLDSSAQHPWDWQTDGTTSVWSNPLGGASSVYGALQYFLGITNG